MRPGSVLCLIAAALLGSCGGGVTFGYGDFFGDDIPPSVNLASPVTSVRAGQTVRLVAAASDSDSGVDGVSFFLIQGINSSLLGTDRTEPFEWVVTAPTDGTGTISVYARAQDRAGNWADSVTVTVSVTQ